MTLTGGQNWWADEWKQPFLQAPPFPGAGPVRLAEKKEAVGLPRAENDAQFCIEALRRLRVGGAFWARQPALPGQSFILARPANADQALQMQREAAGAGAPLLFWFPNATAARMAEDQALPPLIGSCDPWHLLQNACAAWLDGGDPIALVAALAHCPLRLFGAGPYACLAETPDALVKTVQKELLDGYRYIEPFHGHETEAFKIIDLLGQWRELIDANRPISAVFGMAFWKRGAVEPLLWGGEGPVPFRSATADALPKSDENAIAVWKARVPSAFLAAAEERKGPMLEVEDGFIRSAGLGADCVPPLSIVVDSLHAHYDPSGPSGLEAILLKGDFFPTLLSRAQELRRLIISTGISKYGVGKARADRLGGKARHILVTGQVEDDRSVLLGGGGVAGNFDLLQRVRALAPGAHIIYRPHPDVDAGHRKGHISDTEALAVANEIAREAPITALIDMADEVHVLTSLAGFEALLRGKPVTTHGVPFYSGWGLTTDLGPVPARRNIRRSLDELVAATLLLYPRYLDPISNLPCPPEILIERLATGVKKENSLIVMLRRLQGTLVRSMKGF